MLTTLGLSLALTAGAHAERLALRSYTIADGLVRDHILRIVRDSRGFLWFCTFEGLSRFDGHAFINYTTGDGLPHRSIRDLLETHAGEYWIATGAGVVRMNVRASRSSSIQAGGSQAPEPLFTVHYPGTSELSRSIHKIYEDRKGTVWIGTMDGLYRMAEVGGRVTFQPVDLGMPSRTGDDRLVEHILEDRFGTLWVATRGSGLYRRESNGRLDRYSSREGLPVDRVNVLLEDRDGRLWAGTSVGLALLVSTRDPTLPGVVRRFTSKDGLPGDWINDLFQDTDGTIWIAANRGLGAFTTPSRSGSLNIRTYTQAHGLSEREIEALAEDRDGNLWVGTPTKGAMKLARNGFATYGVDDGLGIPVTGSVFLTRSGDLCIFGSDRLARFDGTRFVSIRPNFGRLSKFAWAWRHVALQDRSERWWFATGHGLYRFPKVRRMEDLAHAQPEAIYTVRDGLEADDVHLVYEDRNGVIWVETMSSGRSGLMRWDVATGTFQRFSGEDGWPADTWINAIADDREGNVWLSTHKGLARYGAGGFKFLTTADGLPTNAVNSTYFDEAHRLWVATDTSGVVRVENPMAVLPGIRTYTMSDGLASNQTFSITSDRWGRIYISTGRGVDRLDPTTGQVRNYTAADGLPGSGIPIAYRDGTNALWFGGAESIARFVPEPDHSRQPSPTWIAGLRVSGLPRPVPELGVRDLAPLQLEPDERQLSIDFFGLGFGPGEILRYQYRLDGADQGWSRPTDARTVHYANLSSGRYRFLVRAVMGNGATSPSPASVTFTIAAPIWLRAWFLALTGSCLVLAMHVGYRYRVRRLLEIERVRTRIATDLHDDLGASLSRVAILSEVVKRRIKEADGQSESLLTEIADSARGLVGSVRDIVWAIDARQGDLTDVASRVRQFASTVLDANEIKWRLDAPGDAVGIKLDPEARRHILLFFKEAIHNIARHADCDSVELSLKCNGQVMTCEVADDGKGFDLARSGLTEDVEGRGLRSMQSRALQLSGRLDLQSAPGRGTRIQMTVPVKRRRRRA